MHRISLIAFIAALFPTTATAQWTPNGAPLTLAPQNQNQPIAVSDGGGGAYVAWIDTRNGNPDVYVQRVTAAGTIAPGWPDDGLAVCTHNATQSDLAIGSDGFGAVLAWADTRNGLLDIYAMRVQPGGSVDPGWTVNGNHVCNVAQNQSAPTVVGDGSGGAFIVWTDGRGATEDLYGVRLLTAGTLDPNWTANGSLLCNAARAQYAPVGVPDGAGGVYLAWIDGRAGTTFVADRDVYAMRFTATGALVAGWQPNGTAVAVHATTDQDTPVLCPDGVGGVLFAWQDGRSGTRALPAWDIYASRLLGDGTLAPGWTANGTPACTAAELQISPVITNDGSGGAIVAWQDGRDTSTFPTNTDIYAQHILPGGALAPGWPTTGLDLSPAQYRQDDPTIVSDQAGGAIVAWEDGRGSGGIHATRVSGSGTIVPPWPAAGLELCDAPDVQIDPSAVPDEAGGVIVAWTDPRNGGGNYDVFAQRVTGSGSIGPTVGVPGGPGSPGVAGVRLALAGRHPATGVAAFDVALPRETDAQAHVVNPAGRQVAVLWSGENRTEGVHRLVWNGRDDRGRRATAGVYWLRVVSPAGGASLRFVYLP
ncbi:MAG: hypothetical protein ACREOU_05150 [Candidatus Eiseniibacteriota bacterium]